MQNIHLAIVSQCGIFCNGQKHILKRNFQSAKIRVFQTIADLITQKPSEVNVLIFKPENGTDYYRRELHAFKKIYPSTLVIGVFFNHEHLRGFKYFNHLDVVVDGKYPEEQIVQLIQHHKPQSEWNEEQQKKITENLSGLCLKKYVIYCQLNKLRRKYLLHFSEGKSVEEVAQIENCSLMRAKRAYIELQKIFGLDKTQSLVGFVDGIFAELGSTSDD